MRIAVGMCLVALGGVGFEMVGSKQAPPSFKNIEIAGQVTRGFPPVEPSVAVSGKDPRSIVAGVVLDDAISTHDGGATWSLQHLKDKHRVDGDPCLFSDSSGRFYYIHLATPSTGGWPDRIVCQRSLDGGKTWSEGSTVDFNPPTNQDKAWGAAYPGKPWVVATWTQFEKYGSKDPMCLSDIRFSLSKDAGQTWSPAVKISEISGNCVDDSDTTEGAIPVVSRSGDIYVAWSNQGIIFFNRSTDNGRTWLKHNIAAAKQFGGWDMPIPGLDRSNGMPVLAIDNGTGPNKGSLYCVWADQRHGPSDTDIYLSRSRDHGNTWSDAVRVNQDPPGKEQFLPWISVDPTTGYIYVVYYDRRAYDDLETDVYVAYSTDGGVTFKERKISESPFTPTDHRFFGDYNNISANHGEIVPIWTRMDDQRTSVWTAVIKQRDLVGR